MDKKILYFVYAAIILIVFQGCSIYEEMTFYKDGKVTYNFNFDAGGFLKMFPDKGLSSSGFPSDSIISLAEVIKKDKKQILQSHPELANDLENISGFFIRLSHNPSSSEYKISLYGDFKDASALNNAFASMEKIISKAPDNVKNPSVMGNDLMMWIGRVPAYAWDGKTMTRVADREPAEKSNSGLFDDSMSDWKHFLEGSKMSVKYNFPNKVESVSDTTALISQNGKSVIIEYDGTVFGQHPEKANIEIQVKK